MRMAPHNISLVAVVVGASLDVRRGRWAASPYVEGGLGQVEAQYDAGGILVGNESSARYVPFWRRVQGSSLGSGGGLDLRVIIAPRVLLNASVGAWRFSTPDLSPALPRVAGSLGVSWALHSQ
jgi:hypothetical protein